MDVRAMAGPWQPHICGGHQQGGICGVLVEGHRQRSGVVGGGALAATPAPLPTVTVMLCSACLAWLGLLRSERGRAADASAHAACSWPRAKVGRGSGARFAQLTSLVA